jgi:hypothetical protein
MTKYWSGMEANVPDMRQVQGMRLVTYDPRVHHSGAAPSVAIAAVDDSEIPMPAVSNPAQRED